MAPRCSSAAASPLSVRATSPTRPSRSVSRIPYVEVVPLRLDLCLKQQQQQFLDSMNPISRSKEANATKRAVAARLKRRRRGEGRYPTRRRAIGRRRAGRHEGMLYRADSPDVKHGHTAKKASSNSSLLSFGVDHTHSASPNLLVDFLARNSTLQRTSDSIPATFLAVQDDVTSGRRYVVQAASGGTGLPGNGSFTMSNRHTSIAL